MDFSEPMLDAARRRLADAENVEFRLGSIERLPLESGSVDAAVAMLVLHHVEDAGGALSELRRVVKRGGVALVVDMFEHTREEYQRTMGHVHMGFDPARLRTLFRRAGFEAPRIVPLSGDPDSKGPSLFSAVARASGSRESINHYDDDR